MRVSLQRFYDHQPVRPGEAAICKKDHRRSSAAMTCCREGPRLWRARTRLHPSEIQAGDEVGISTVYRVPCGPKQRPRFAHRMFIQRPNRVPVMTHFMTGKAYEFLIGIATDDKRPGSIIVIENGKPVDAASGPCLAASATGRRVRTTAARLSGNGGSDGAISDSILRITRTWHRTN